MNTSFKVIGLTRLEIKPESTVPEANALATRLSALRRACCLTSAVQTYFSFQLKFLFFFIKANQSHLFIILPQLFLHFQFN